MSFSTITILKNDDTDEMIEEGTKIKVFLENGEILIGNFESSDCLSLIIERNNESIEIDFEEVKNIEKLEEV